MAAASKGVEQTVAALGRMTVAQLREMMPRESSSVTSPCSTPNTSPKRSSVAYEGEPLPFSSQLSVWVFQ